MVAIAILLSLVSPWAAICLPGAPGAMPCCASKRGEQPPSVRACCGPKTPAPASVQVPSSSAAVHAPSPVFLPVALKPAASAPERSAASPRAPRVDINLLNAVLLI